MNDLWYWDPVTNKMNEMPVSSVSLFSSLSCFLIPLRGSMFDFAQDYPPGRAFHASLFRSYLLIYGGYGIKPAEAGSLDSDDDPEKMPPPQALDDMWGYDVALAKWVAVSITPFRPLPVVDLVIFEVETRRSKASSVVWISRIFEWRVHVLVWGNG